MGFKYFITRNGDETEVSFKEFVNTERTAGFRPKPGCGPIATGGFSTYDPQTGERVVGRVVCEETAND